LEHVPVASLSFDRFQTVLEKRRWRELSQELARGLEVLAQRVVWNVNSTARGGGVAEMLASLIAYGRGIGADARWVVIQGDADFFTLTKRIHNSLHGICSAREAPMERERSAYERTLSSNARELCKLVRPGDIVVLHDPQTAGLVPFLEPTGALVIWRAHIGLDHPNDCARRAWAFLLPYVREADAVVFSRRDHAWDGLDETKITIIPPSIDVFSPKNQSLDAATVLGILRAAGLIEKGGPGPRSFVRLDGNVGEVSRRAYVLEEAQVPGDSRLVVQVSRWDRLKDPIGVIRGFAEHIVPDFDAHLICAGPAVEAVADDPEAADVLSECEQTWHRLPRQARERIHLACLPMHDVHENGAIVNALQRRADVVVQKSLAEGFGLTVSEAMWKARPVVASRIGGIQDQILDGVTGVLIDDPADLTAFGASVGGLLDDQARAENMGQQAHERVRDQFMGSRHLIQYADLFESLIRKRESQGGRRASGHGNPDGPNTH
jgi:trehalose synthase